jgi:hypothetical protein
MSVYKSYFNRNNTIVLNSYANTGRNPITELFFGRVDNITAPKGYSRLLFNIELSGLTSKLSDGVISTGCSNNMKHTLRMTNTSSFDNELLNGQFSNGRRRATSFDLVLFRIPKVSGSTGTSQNWDEGVGYDYYDFNELPTDKAYSSRPSNWYESETISNWSVPGLYDNENNNSISGLNFSGLTIIDTQHFEFGNEDISFDMTNEVNDILTGATTGVTGWGVAFYPQVENITGLTENYSVGFFTRHTQTFYEPYLETKYDDLIQDDRNIFYATKENRLYLYSYVFGNPQNFDDLPTVDIQDSSGVISFLDLPTCQIADGVYEVKVSGLTPTTIPCMYYDVWKNLKVNGVPITNVTNEFVVNDLSDYYQIGSTTNEPSIYGFDFFGIKQDEKILGNDTRKVNVIIKKAYTTNEIINKVDAYYRVYVREGKTEVQVQDWTKINRTPDSHYFIFYTDDKIPNEYYIDLKVITDREVNTYKRELKFQIVNRK